jgi:hypothetical protein
VRHTQRTANDGENAKAFRRLVALTAMDSMGFAPDLSVWRSEGFDPRAVPLSGCQGLERVYVSERITGADVRDILAMLRVCGDGRGVQLTRGVGDAVTAVAVDGFELHIETQDGMVHCIHPLGINVTVGDVLRLVEETAGIPVPHHRLIFDGRPLLESGTLAEYGIETGDSLGLFRHMTGC